MNLVQGYVLELETVGTRDSVESVLDIISFPFLSIDQIFLTWSTNPQNMASSSSLIYMLFV